MEPEQKLIDQSESPSTSKKMIGNYVIRCNEPLESLDYGDCFKGYAKNTPFVTLEIHQMPISFPEKDFEVLQKTLQDHVGPIRGLVHENIKHLHDLILTSRNLYIVQELCDEGTLDQIKGDISLLDSLVCVKQIAKAMIYANNNKITHGYLRPSSVYINNSSIKVGDFGLTKALESKTICDLVNFKRRFPYYMAPEVAFGGATDYKSDVWSLGVMLYELVFKQRPWFTPGMTVAQFFNDVKKKKLEFPEKADLDPRIPDLISNMLNLRKEYRYNFGEVMNHDLFQNSIPDQIKKRRK